MNPMNQTSSTSTCSCQAPQQPSTSDLHRAYRHLARKHQQLADAVAHLVSQTAVARPARAAARQDELHQMVARIVGGVPTAPTDFKECCLIGRKFPNGAVEWFCSGVLVHPRIVLTAAHCQHAPSPGINLVALNATNQNDLSNSEIIAASRATANPAWRNGGANDITVVVLKKAARTGPVAIATTADLAAATETTLVGFGNNDIQSTRGFGLKRQVTVPVKSVRRKPSDDLHADESEFGYQSDLEFVAGGHGFDSCNGDSGGPAYLGSGRSVKVAGLTSRATANAVDNCGDGGIYTRIDQQLNFINTVAAAAHLHNFNL